MADRAITSEGIARTRVRSGSAAMSDGGPTPQTFWIEHRGHEPGCRLVQVNRWRARYECVDGCRSGQPWPTLRLDDKGRLEAARCQGKGPMARPKWWRENGARAKAAE